jgi:hypothetical protein
MFKELQDVRPILDINVPLKRQSPLWVYRNIYVNLIVQFSDTF